MRRTRQARTSFASRAAAIAAFLIPVAAAAQVGNAPVSGIPVLDGAGIASMAGVITMTGAWLLARRRARKP